MGAINAGTIMAYLDMDTTGFTSAFDTASASMNGFAGSETINAVSGLEAVIGKVGAAVAGLKIGEKLLEIGQNVVQTGMSFDSQMSRVRAIAGATGEEFEKLRQTAIDLGASTTFSGIEAAEGMENLASAGFATNEIIAAMPGMLDLAASSGESLASSASIAASTLRSFGLEADQAGHVADVLAANAAKTNAAVADTGEAMKYVAPMANAMGLSLEEVTAAIGIMSDAGIMGSQAGTTLRGALSRLAKPTEDMSAVMTQLGLDFYDSSGQMKSLEETVGMLQSNMSGLTAEQQQNALVTLFGQEALSGLMVLMEAGTEKLGALTDAYESCDGAAAEMAATMTDNLGGDVEALTGSLETAAQSIYDKFEPALRAGVQAAGGLVDAFNAGGISGVFDHIVTSAQNVDWAGIGTSIQTGVTGVFDAAGEWLGGHFTTALTAAQNTDWAALGASIHAGAVEKLDAAGAWLSGLFEAGKTAASNVPWGEIGIAIWNGITGVIDAAGNFLSGLFTGGKDAAVNIPWDEIGTTILGGVTGVLDTAGTFLSGIFTAGKDAAALVPWGEIGTSIQTGVNGVIDAGGIFLSGAFQAAKTTIEGIQWGDVGSKISSGLSGALDTLGKIGGNIWDTITGWFSDDESEDGRDSAETSAASMMSGLESGVKGGESGAATAASTAATSMLNALTAVLNQESGSGVTTTFMNGVTSGITTSEPTLTTAMQTAATATVTMATNTLTAAAGSGVTTTFVGGLTSGIMGSQGTLTGQMSTTANAAATAASGIMSFSVGYGIGSNIVQGMASGVRSSSGSLYSAITSIAYAAVARARSALAINSPSGVFADMVGAWIPGGIGQGALEHMQDALGPIETIRDSMVEVFDSGFKGVQLGGAGIPWQPGGNQAQQININITGDWTVRSDEDRDEIIDELYERISEELRRR